MHAGIVETNIACLKSKQKGSIDEKDTMFLRDHCAGSDSAEWALTARNGLGIAGEHSFKPPCQLFIRGGAVDEVSCPPSQAALPLGGGRLLDQNDEL